MLDKEEYSNEETVESWVMEKCNHWRDHFTNNYEEKFDEYNRLWRGHFSEEDKTRNSLTAIRKRQTVLCGLPVPVD